MLKVVGSSPTRFTHTEYYASGKGVDMIELGDRVRDRMTRFDGIVIAITEWLYNCRRITVQPTDLDKDGAVAKTESFDEDQLEIVEKRAFIPRVQAQAQAPVEKTGGPRDMPSRRITPSR